MKKILYFASAAVCLAATSCSDDFAPGQSNIPEGKSAIYATFPNLSEPDTRSYANPNGTGWSIKWQEGDALGVYGSNVNNATYVFATTQNDDETSTTSKFVGQANLNTTNTYLSYYPYNPAGLNNGNIAVYINANQNFNYSKSGLAADTYGEPGSFSQNSMPAIAVGTVSEENSLDMNFDFMASAFRFPITGIGDITNVQLTLANTSAQNLNLTGYYEVPVNTIINASNPATALSTQLKNFTYKNLQGTTNTTIDLSFGDGVTLSQTEPIWVWFVVPAGIPLPGLEMTLTFKPAGETAYDTKNAITQKLNTTSPETVAGTVYNIKSFGNWEYMGGKAILENAWQFIEYAYVATNGVSQSLLDAYNKLTDTSFTQLDKILEYNDATQGIEGGLDNITGLKSAIVIGGNVDAESNTLVVSPAQLAKEILNGAQIGGIVGLTGYYNTIYQEYLPTTEQGNGYIGTIGGTYGVTLDGSSDAGIATISGLVVNGNDEGDGMLVGQVEDLGFNIQNITFSGCQVIQSEENEYGYNFVNGTFNSYVGKNVTFENCKITDPKGASLKGALFGWIDDTDLSGMANVTYAQAGMPFANELTINQSLNISTLDLEGAFNSIEIQSDNVVVTVSGLEQANWFITNANNVDSEETEYGYSVTDGTTSYWTGSIYETDTYAEGLAYYNTTSTDTRKEGFTLTMNLDLGSTRELSWPITSLNQRIDITGGGYQITNVLIDGEGATNVNNYSIFGGNAAVTNLKIGNVTIRNYYGTAAPNTNALIAILATNPSTSATAYPTNNVTVTGTITIDVQGTLANPAGGFYQTTANVQNAANFNSATCTYEGGNNYLFPGVQPSNFGYLAGVGAEIAVKGTSTDFALPAYNTQNVFEGLKPYGEISIKIPFTTGQTEVTLTATEGYPFAGPQDLNMIPQATNTYAPTVLVYFDKNDYSWAETSNLGQVYYIYTYTSKGYIFSNDYKIVGPDGSVKIVRANR